MEANGGAQARVDLYITELAMRSLEQQINWLRSDRLRANTSYNLSMWGTIFFLGWLAYFLVRLGIGLSEKEPFWSVFYCLGGLLLFLFGIGWLWKKDKPKAKQSLEALDQELEGKRAEYRLHWEMLSALAAVKPAASQPVDLDGPADEAPPSAEPETPVS